MIQIAELIELMHDENFSYTCLNNNYNNEYEYLC